MPQITLPQIKKGSPNKSVTNSTPKKSDNPSQAAFADSDESDQRRQPAQQTQPPVNPMAGGGMGAAGNDFGGGGGMGWNNDPWADPWGTGAPNQNANQPKKLTPQERVKMIEVVYQEVLKRKPDTRDINYYKYSTLGEDEIRKQLLEGKEHKQLVEDGREYKKMKERAEQSEIRVKMLEGQIKDQVEEFKQLTHLLDEKNRFIRQLRGNGSSVFIPQYEAPVQQQSVVNEPVEMQQVPISEEAVAVPQYTPDFGQTTEEVSITQNPVEEVTYVETQYEELVTTQQPQSSNQGSPVFNNAPSGEMPTSNSVKKKESISDKIKSIFSI